MLGLALHNSVSVHGAFPPAAAGRKPNQPPVSWRVLILPYVDQSILYQQYRFDEPWDSENNKKLIARMPVRKNYLYPGQRICSSQTVWSPRKNHTKSVPDLANSSRAKSNDNVSRSTAQVSNCK